MVSDTGLERWVWSSGCRMYELPFHYSEGRHSTGSEARGEEALGTDRRFNLVVAGGGCGYFNLRGNNYSECSFLLGKHQEGEDNVEIDDTTACIVLMENTILQTL